MGAHFGFLFARPSAIEGVGRLIDFGNTLCEYNRSLTPEQADAIALSTDWASVGDDMTEAFWQCLDAEQDQVFASANG